jgi:hypothetical protein
MKNLERFLKLVEQAEEMTADTEKVRDGAWTVNRNQTNTDYEGGDYQDPRIAVLYDGTQGHNGWYWEVIEGKDVVGTSDQVFKTADDAKEDAEMWIERLIAQSDGEPDLGRIGEGNKKPFFKNQKEKDEWFKKFSKTKISDKRK